ncbi:hypothetical protein T439DRAFT_327661 [Meredithblackwellia eburnea MCA 4105]
MAIISNGNNTSNTSTNVPLVPGVPQLETIPTTIPSQEEPKSFINKLVHDQLNSNPIFSAGFGLMAVGVSLTILRKSLVTISTIAQRRLLVSLEISSKDPSYIWFLKWMSNPTSLSPSVPPPPRGLLGRIEDILARRVKSHELAVETKYEIRKDGSSKAEFALVPGPGTHYFRFRGAWFQVKRERATNMLDLNSGTPWETLHLTTLSRDRSLFADLLLSARQQALQSQAGHTIVYTAWGAEWKPFGRPRGRRGMESVVLKQGLKEMVKDDLDGFMKRGEWYFERGIPYRRGYLFHGPPGSGKSSFIQALAGSLEYNICVLNLSERGLTDDKLNHLLVNAPERSVVLLEDVDAAFVGRQAGAAGGGEKGFNPSVTFSGLLNALDGVASSTSQRLLFMTTNHIELLDPALIRPGRVDLKVLIGDADEEMAGRLFRRFYRIGPEDASPAHPTSTPGASPTPPSTSSPSPTISTSPTPSTPPSTPPSTTSSITTSLANSPTGSNIDPDPELTELTHQLQSLVSSSPVPISMAALQGHFIRHSRTEAVHKFGELVEEVREGRKVGAAGGGARTVSSSSF